MNEREARRRSFNEIAARYQKARPTYPQALFEALARFVPLNTQSRVLEIGCGPGIASVPLAKLGLELLAVEPGDKLAQLASERLSTYPKAKVIVSSFEDFPLPTAPFDLVLAATSFHWIDEKLRFHKSAEALRPGGVLAVVAAHHIEGGTQDFFVSVQECYQRFAPQLLYQARLPSVEDVKAEADLIDTSGRFSPPVRLYYEEELSYSAEDYTELLLTYSEHLILPEPMRSSLIDSIKTMIQARYHDQIKKRYLFSLRLSRRL